MELRVEPADRIWVAGLAVATLAILIYAIGSKRRTRLTVLQGGLIYRGLRGERHVATPRGTTVVEVAVRWNALSDRRSRLWVLLAPDGRAQASLVADAFDRDQLEQVRHALGLPVKRLDVTLRPSHVRDAYPKALPAWTAHPNFVAAVGTVVAIAVAGALLP